MLASLQRGLFAVLALGALHSQHDLLGGLGLLPEDGLGLATESLLFAIVTTTALGGTALLRLLVLRDLVQLVALALLAEGLTLLGNVHLEEETKSCYSPLLPPNLTNGVCHGICLCCFDSPFSLTSGVACQRITPGGV